MSEMGVSVDRFVEEEGLLYVGSPFAAAGEDDLEDLGGSSRQADGPCRCGGHSSEPGTFHDAGGHAGPEGAGTHEPERVSLDAVLRRAFDDCTDSEPKEARHLRWIHDDLRGWLGVRLGFAPGLAWSLTDVWEHATRVLKLLPDYIELRSFELPGNRDFVLGAAILVREIGRTLAREGLGAAAAHHAVWMAAEAGESEAQPRVA